MARTPLEVIDVYVNRIWNDHEFELMDEVLAENILRYEPNGVSSLSREDWKIRVKHQAATASHTSSVCLFGDEHHAVTAWNVVTLEGEELKACGIEIFRIEEGRIVAVWNTPWVAGNWGCVGDGPKAAEKPVLLNSVSEVSVDWLQNVFAYNKTEVPRVAIIMTPRYFVRRPDVEVARVGVPYNGNPAGAPVSIVVKVNTASGSKLGEAISNEIRAYKLLNGLDIDSVAIAYLADENGKSQMLILEDLQQRPGQHTGDLQNEVVEGELVDAKLLDGSTTEKAVDALAAMHRKLDGAANSGDFAPSTIVDAQVIADLLKDAELKIAGEAKDMLSVVQDAVARLERASSGASKLVHGAPVLSNLVENQTDDGSEICFVDFKFFGLGAQEADLAALLATAVSTEDRRANERDWLSRYASAVGISEQDVSDRYRESAAAGLNALAREYQLAEDSKDYCSKNKAAIERAVDLVLDAAKSDA